MLKCVGLLLLYFFFVLPSALYARERLTIAPAYQDIELSKGASVSTTLSITNATTTPVTFSLYPVTFVMDESGAVRFLTERDDTTSFARASYIKLPQETLLVESQSTETLTYTISDRQDLSPGGHYAAIIAIADIDEKDGPFASHVTPALTSLLLVRKTGGEIFNMSLKNVNWPHRMVHLSYPDSLSLTFQNEGNVHLVPRGRIEIHDMLGRLTHKGVLNQASQYVFPSSRRTLTVSLLPLTVTLPFSIDRISVTGNDSLNKVSYVYRNTYVYVHPLAALGVLAVLFFACYIGYRRRKNQAKSS